MKAKMSYKSKRLAIIVAIIVALIIAISIGTYYFIKGNEEVGAAYENTQSIEENNNGESEVTEPSQNQEENQNDENETEISDENNDENQTQNETTEENEGDESVSQEGTPTEGTTTGTSNPELPNEEYTQTEIIEREEERIEEGLTVTWAGLSLANAQISSDIVTSGPNLEINKVAKLNSINENDNAIQKGSKITYEITVANTNTEVVAKNVNISDIIPEGTTLVENSISHNGIEVEDKISWVIPEITSENPITVSFTVEVVNEKGEIKNTAVVDGKNTPETINPVIETSKTVSSENSVLTELKEGSEIEYSIKVTNTSKEEQVIAKTTVKDIVPEGTTLVEGSITGTENYTVEEVNGQKVITWNDITLNPEESKELKFKVTINAFEGESKEIKNAALVGDTNTNEETVTVYNPILSIEKSANPEEVSEGDTITYTITVENDGKVDGLATIKDNIPTGTTFTNASIEINNETTTKTANELAQGIQINVPAEDSVTLTFKVTVNNNSGLTGNISNTAYLVDEKGNEKPTDPTETKVEAKIVFVENGGTGVADIDGYAGDIIENRNPVTTKDGYDFDGWYTEPEFTNKVEQLPEKMVAGTTTYYAKWTARDDTKYTVEHYLQNLDDEEYTLDEDATETKTGTTGAQTQAVAKDYTGFKAQEFEQETIAGNGTTVVKIYYNRNSYKVTYEYEGTVPEGASKLPGEATYKYEANVTVAEGATAPGYAFSGWDREDFTMPAENVVIKGSFTARDDTKYKVEHYLQNLDNEEYTLDEDATEIKYGTTGAQTQAVAKDYAGFKAQEFEQETIAGNGTTVVKIYYNRNSYKVTYEYEGTVPEGASKLPGEATYKYEANVTVAEGATAPGYAFSGWDREDFTMPAENVVIKGSFTARDDTKYKVEHYLQNLDNEEYTLDEDATEIKYGTTGAQTQAVAKDYAGFKAQEFEQETIAGNGTTVVKIYYTRNSYKVTYEYEGKVPAGASELPGKATYKYEEKVTVAAGAIAPGYTFSGWDRKDFTMPAEDVVIKGSFTAMPKPSLTLTKTALDINKEQITEIEYDSGTNNYMYYRLKVENTVQGSYPEKVNNQTITDNLPLGMTIEGSLPEGVSTKTVSVNGENRTQVIWNVSDIGNGANAKQIDIKVKIDEEVFKGKEVDAGTETTVISDIVADDIEDYNEGNSNDKHNTMSMFVRFASPTDGNSGYLYAGTTKAANRNMPSGEAFVPGYNDDIINSNINNEEKLANMLDDFVTANNNGTMSKYTAYGLPTTNTVKRFLENNYGISLTDNQIVLWYKVVDASEEKSRTRRYEITNKNTGNITYKDIKMSACSYHIDGIIVDVRSLGTLIPDGATVNVVNTASVQTTSNMWENTTSSVSTLIYYNSKIESTQNMSVQTLSVQSTNILSKALSKVETEEINQVNIDEVIEKIEKSEIENEAIEQENNNVTENIVENETIENTVNKQEELDNNLIMDDINKTTEQSNNLLNNESSQENETTVDSSEIFNEDITENVVDENVETEENKIEEIKEENEELNQ